MQKIGCDRRLVRVSSLIRIEFQGADPISIPTAPFHETGSVAEIQLPNAYMHVYQRPQHVMKAQN